LRRAPRVGSSDGKIAEPRGWIVVRVSCAKHRAKFESNLVDFVLETRECGVLSVLHEFFVGNRLAVLECDARASPVKAGLAVPREAIETALQCRGNDGCLAHLHEQRDAALERLHRTVKAATAFGEDDDGPTLAESAQNFLDRRGVAALLFDGSGVEVAKHEAEDATLEQAGARDERALTLVIKANKRRIEV